MILWCYEFLDEVRGEEKGYVGELEVESRKEMLRMCVEKDNYILLCVEIGSF